MGASSYKESLSILPEKLDVPLSMFLNDRYVGIKKAEELVAFVLKCYVTTAADKVEVLPEKTNINKELSKSKKLINQAKLKNLEKVDMGEELDNLYSKMVANLYDLRDSRLAYILLKTLSAVKIKRLSNLEMTEPYNDKLSYSLFLLLLNKPGSFLKYIGQIQSLKNVGEFKIIMHDKENELLAAIIRAGQPELFTDEVVNNFLQQVSFNSVNVTEYDNNISAWLRVARSISKINDGEPLSKQLLIACHDDVFLMLALLETLEMEDLTEISKDLDDKTLAMIFKSLIHLKNYSNLHKFITLHQNIIPKLNNLSLSPREIALLKKLALVDSDAVQNIDKYISTCYDGDSLKFKGVLLTVAALNKAKPDFKPVV